MHRYKHLLRQTALIVFTITLTGCASTRVTYLPTEPVIVGSPYTSPYTEREDALGILLNHAYLAIEAGDLDQAGSWLSRAMRISPTEPAIYFHMAEIRKEQGDAEQARQLIGRAMSLGPDRKMTARLETLLESLES